VRARTCVLLATVLASFCAAVSARAATSTYAYATMSDGVKIALAITYPPDYDPSNPGARTYPAIFGMTGYTGSMDLPASNKNYVEINVTHRGTGCSGGQFEPFSDRVAQDGYDLIENWIAKQLWSNGDVGVTGSSWGGLDAILVASTAPPHLKVVAASGLTDDFYRDISYPGGVGNAGFPLLWGSQREAPVTEQHAIEGRMQEEITANDPTCAANIATRPPHVAFFAQSTAHEFDDDYWRSHSLNARAPHIAAPTWIGHTWQDSGTGPSGAYLWERIADAVPKRLAVSNGDHGASSVDQADRTAWIDCWLLKHGQSCPGDLTDPSRRVRIYFETTGVKDTRKLNPPLVASDFPVPDAPWQKLFLRAGGALSTDAPGASEIPDSYSTSAVADSAAAFSRSFAAPTTIAGPIAATVWVSTPAPDADVYVAVVDVDDATGNQQYLQRGVLRASHRALDEARSKRITSGELAGAYYRPYHLDTAESLQPLIPNEPARLDIQVWPVAHLFRAGHRLRVEVRAVPASDFVGQSYDYATLPAGADVSVLHDAAHPSSVLIPFVNTIPAVADAGPGCGGQTGIFCIGDAVDQPPPEPGEIDQGAVYASGMFGKGQRVASAVSLVNGQGTMVFRAPAFQPPPGGAFALIAMSITTFSLEGSVAYVEGVCADESHDGASAPCFAVFTDGVTDTISLTYLGQTKSGPVGNGAVVVQDLTPPQD
jgi:uncharacterized protein